jgi:acyl-CoA synthetase (AMP-forming)/AMP-acid ligase II
VRPGAAAPDLEALREWCRARLAPFKLPERLVVVDVLPYNELGKLPRRAVAALFDA